MDDGRWTMDVGRWTLDDGRWTLDLIRKGLDFQLFTNQSTVHCLLSNILLFIPVFLFLHQNGGLVNGFTNARIGSAAAKVAGHGQVDVRIGGLGFLAQ